MKCFSFPGADYYIGTARDIKSLYKNLAEKTIYWPLFTEEPVFNMNRMYGLEVITHDDSTKNSYYVIGETDCMYLLMGVIDIKSGGTNYIVIKED